MIRIFFISLLFVTHVDSFSRISSLSYLARAEIVIERQIISHKTRDNLLKMVIAENAIPAINLHKTSSKENEKLIIESTIQYLNSPGCSPMLENFAQMNTTFLKEYESANFWFGGSFVVSNCSVTSMSWQGLTLLLNCVIKSKPSLREVFIPFPNIVDDPTSLKLALIDLAVRSGKISETANIARLSFGDDWSMPRDFRFNDVPHATWVRAYINDIVKTSVLDAVTDHSITCKSRMQLRINFPEVNPAFDTYRIGTLLEIIRHTALALALGEAADGRPRRVRICVQQSLGEGVFAGLPLAIAAVRAILDRMDWGTELRDEQKPERLGSKDSNWEESRQMIRLGAVGKDVVKNDDDVFLVIAPQNMIGASVLDLLEEMVQAAAGRPVILINPILGDRPSSNNVMQVRGRSDRRQFSDSFTDIFCLRLLYPSSGGYMFPIRGMIAKTSHRSPWMLYDKRGESYEAIAALPPHPPPDPTFISDIFLQQK